MNDKKSQNLLRRVWDLIIVIYLDFVICNFFGSCVLYLEI